MRNCLAAIEDFRGGDMGSMPRRPRQPPLNDPALEL